MSKHYFIYTVTGGHEVFYAAVDRDTDRVWTAPTKEVAHRQAQEAGLETFTERLISKDALLQSLGIDSERRLAIDPEQSRRREPDPPPPSKTPWFVAGEGSEDAPDAPQKFPRLPAMGGRRKSRRMKGGKSPFAANQPIAPAAPRGDDVLIVPTAADHAPMAPTPFSDKPAAKPDESLE